MPEQRTVILLQTLALDFVTTLISLYLSFSIPYFFEPKTINKKRHYYLSGGFKKELNEKLLINPNFLIKKSFEHSYKYRCFHHAFL